MRNLCNAVVVLALGTGCGKAADGGEARRKTAAGSEDKMRGDDGEARRKAAAGWEDKMRGGGFAAGISTRGEGSKVLVLKFSEENDVCSQEFIDDMAKGPPDPKSTEFGVAAMTNLGFNRFECETKGRVLGTDLPFVAKP